MKNAINRALAAKKTKVFFSALCLLVSMTSCAQSKSTAKSGSTTKETQVIKMDGGNVIVVNTSDSTVGKHKRINSMTITKSGNDNGNTVYMVKSDGGTTIATSLETYRSLLTDTLPEFQSLSKLKNLSKLPVLAPDSMPQFPGGMSAMMTYLMENVKYPKDAKKAKKEGRTICSFVITKEGKVTEAHVVKSSGTESLDNEALRVVNNMPEWEPGKENGEPVNVHYSIPVVFKLK